MGMQLSVQSWEEHSPRLNGFQVLTLQTGRQVEVSVAPAYYLLTTPLRYIPK